MQKWYDDDDNLMYLTHNESKSVVVERFKRTLKGKIYKKMKYSDSKSYLGYLNKLVDEYSNTYHCSISKKSVGANNYSALTKEIETHLKASKFKVDHRVRIT